MHRIATSLFLLVSLHAFAQPEPEVVARAPVEPPTVVRAPKTAEVNAAEGGRTVGVNVALNVGLFGIDLHRGHFYGFLAGNVGVPIISNGALGAFALGAGYSIPLSSPGDSMWVADLFATALPGWQQLNVADGAPLTVPFVGFGAGFGFRYLHQSGLVVGFKVPIFGFSVGSASSASGASGSVGMFYLASAIALPVVSFGYRF